MRVSKALELALGSSMGGPTPNTPQEHQLQVSWITFSCISTPAYVPQEDWCLVRNAWFEKFSDLY